MSELLNVVKLIYRADGVVVNETGNDPAIDLVEGYQRYLVAADLGQANDYSGIVVLRDRAIPIYDGNEIIVGPRERLIVYADRFKGVSYVDVVDYLIRLKNAPPFGGRSDLAIDGTSIGRVVSDMLEAQNIEHTAVTMTGGQDWARSKKGGGRYVNAGKTFMIENLAVMFATGDIKFAHDCPLRNEITEDLATFTISTTHAGNQIITQGRTGGGHGDLGIALIVAAFASQYVPPHGKIVHAMLRNMY